MSLTGANADERFTHRPSEAGVVAQALLAALGGGVSAPNIADARLKEGIAKAAKAIQANPGKTLVVSGSNDQNVQILVNAINNLAGSNGTTIDWAVTSNYRQGIDADMVQLVNDMNAGSVGALLVYGVNPAYDYFDAEKFAGRYQESRRDSVFQRPLRRNHRALQIHRARPSLPRKLGVMQKAAAVTSLRATHYRAAVQNPRFPVFTPQLERQHHRLGRLPERRMDRETGIPGSMGQNPAGRRDRTRRWRCAGRRSLHRRRCRCCCQDHPLPKQAVSNWRCTKK